VKSLRDSLSKKMQTDPGIVLKSIVYEHIAEHSSGQSKDESDTAPYFRMRVGVWVEQIRRPSRVMQVRRQGWLMRKRS
jgi:hypothetical protein